MHLNLFTISLFLLSIIGTIVFYCKNQSLKTPRHSHSFSQEYKDSMNHCLKSFEINNLNTGNKMPSFLLENGLYLASYMQKEKQSLLILRVSETNCIDCIEDEMEILQKFDDLKDRILILGTLTTNEFIPILMKKKNIKLAYFSVPANAIDDWPIEKNGKPYYFVLNPTMKASNFYIPEKRYYNINYNYINTIKKLFL